jgi:hypothetical protein
LIMSCLISFALASGASRVLRISCNGGSLVDFWAPEGRPKDECTKGVTDGRLFGAYHCVYSTK